jgi:osmotically-inducible protein OsmY
LAAGCGKSSTSAASMSDDDLEEALSARIDANPQLRAYDVDVDADVDEHRVTLSGTVPTQTLRTQVVNIVKDYDSEFQVTDEIDVDPSKMSRSEYSEEMARDEREYATQAGDKLGDQIDDAWIHTKIRFKLTGEGELPLGGINVDVVNNIVTLRGTVDSKQASADAERIASETEGVSRVVNQLTVKAGE